MNIKDIAKIAGVGVSTVSRVINNHPDVKQDTREKIQEIIQKYNYIPNTSARMLKQNNNSYIGVLVKGGFNPFFSEMVKEIGAEIEKTPYTMILQHDDTNGSDMDALVTFVKERKLKGVIYLGGNFEEVPKIRFEHLGCHSVLLCSNISEKQQKANTFSSVGIDDYHAAYEAMAYIIKKGHRKIGLVIGEKQDRGVGRKRLKGYLDCIAHCGVDKENVFLIEGKYCYDKAYTETLACLKEASHLTALCAMADTMAVGAAKAVSDVGKVIGKDIAVMGFDGMEIATYYNPSLTTVEQPRVQIAKEGIQLLLKQIEQKATHEHIILPTKLLKRASC